MAKELVEVIDRDGHVVASYLVALEHDDCLAAEYEEAALILAEIDGVVAMDEQVHLRARCSGVPEIEPAAKTPSVKPRRQTSTVISLVKHRMKRANFSFGNDRARQAS
jgi:hypothetical protein